MLRMPVGIRTDQRQVKVDAHKHTGGKGCQNI